MATSKYRFVIKAFVDGSRKKTPKGKWGAGWGFHYSYLSSTGVNINTVGRGSDSHPSATAAKMEVYAMMNCLNALPIKSNVLICGDNQYVLKSLVSLDEENTGTISSRVTGWAAGWRKKRWTKSDGKEVKHREEIQQMVSRLEFLCANGSTISFKWVKAKHGKGKTSDDIGNDIADLMAKKAADECDLIR